MFLDLGIHVGLDVDSFGYGFHNQIGFPDSRCHLDDRIDPIERFLGRCVVYPVALDEFFQTSLDLFVSMFYVILLDVA